MKAIQTKYHGPTNFHGSKIIASAGRVRVVASTVVGGAGTQPRHLPLPRCPNLLEASPIRNRSHSGPMRSQASQN